MTDVTFDDVEKEIRRLAAERPDFVYEPEEDSNGYGVNCRYQHGQGVPGCIFGHAFLNLGLPIAENHEGDSANGVLERLGVDVTDDYALWVAEVQAKQDLGDTWSQAVEKADAERATRELPLHHSS